LIVMVVPLLVVPARQFVRCGRLRLVTDKK
jgi:hypothetical protein